MADKSPGSLEYDAAHRTYDSTATYEHTRDDEGLQRAKAADCGASLLHDPILARRAHALPRIAVMSRAQQTCGNHAVQRVLQRSTGQSAARSVAVQRQTEGDESEPVAEDELPRENATLTVDPATQSGNLQLDTELAQLDVGYGGGQPYGQVELPVGDLQMQGYYNTQAGTGGQITYGDVTAGGGVAPGGEAYGQLAYQGDSTSARLRAGTEGVDASLQTQVSDDVRLAMEADQERLRLSGSADIGPDATVQGSAQTTYGGEVQGEVGATYRASENLTVGAKGTYQNGDLGGEANARVQFPTDIGNVYAQGGMGTETGSQVGGGVNLNLPGNPSVGVTATGLETSQPNTAVNFGVDVFKMIPGVSQLLGGE